MTYLSELSTQLLNLDMQRTAILGKENNMSNVEDLQDTLRLEVINRSMARLSQRIDQYIHADMSGRRRGNRPFGQCANNPYFLIFD